jgi:hypothetical protein
VCHEGGNGAVFADLERHEFDARSARLHRVAERDHPAQGARVDAGDAHRVAPVALDQLMVGLVRWHVRRQPGEPRATARARAQPQEGEDDDGSEQQAGDHTDPHRQAVSSDEQGRGAQHEAEQQERGYTGGDGHRGQYASATAPVCRGTLVGAGCRPTRASGDWTERMSLH